MIENAVSALDKLIQSKSVQQMKISQFHSAKIYLTAGLLLTSLHAGADGTLDFLFVDPEKGLRLEQKQKLKNNFQNISEDCINRKGTVQIVIEEWVQEGITQQSTSRTRTVAEFFVESGASAAGIRQRTITSNSSAPSSTFVPGAVTIYSLCQPLNSN